MKKAFSLTETLILITILAIAIAAATPTLTRKIINVTEAGSTLSGGAHGRYELFTKEILKIPNLGDYEKTTDPNGTGKILVFRRLPDEEFTRVKGYVPETNGPLKEALYEQIDDAKVIRDSKGQITYVEYDDDNNSLTPDKRVPIGGDIIVESADVIYVKGNIKDTPDGYPTFVPDKKGDKILPDNKNRIIEGNLTTKDKNHPDTNRPLWHLPCDKNNNDIPVIDIPWERVISGDDVIKDGPVPPTKTPGGGNEYIGKFNPGPNAQNLVVHAVGGGGAGGGIDMNKAPNGVISPKTATTQELNEMKAQLAKRFKDVAAQKGYTGLAGKSTDQIVGVVNSPNLHGKNFESTPKSIANLLGIDRESSENAGKYILLNTYDGTITVRVDVRNGLIFPHELLDYTYVLGSSTQNPIVFDMPEWGKFGNEKSKDGIYNKGFQAGAVGCGCAGGAGMDYTWDEDYDLYCKRAKYCPDGPSGSACTSPTNRCPRCVTCCGGAAAKIDYSKLNKQFGLTGYAAPISFGRFKNNENLIAQRTMHQNLSKIPTSGSGSTPKSTPCSPGYVYDKYACLNMYCTYKCDQHYYTRKKLELNSSGSCGSSATCPDNSGTHMGLKYTHEYKGASGGSAPRCAIAAIRPKGPIDVLVNCEGSCPGASGGKKHAGSGISGTATGLLSGQMGRTCFPRAGGNTAVSMGGGGGSACIQTIADGPGYDSDALLSALHGIVPGVGFDINSNGTVHLVGSTAELAQSNVALSEGALDEFFSFSQSSTKNEISAPWLCQALPSKSCGRNGDPGQAQDAYEGSLDGINHLVEGLYNHIYTWTMPYRINTLTYGEGGGAGEYKTTTIAKPTGEITFKLGKGGVWTKNGNGSFDNKQGPNGGATIVNMGNVNIITAQGGKGGANNKKTHKYDLCYAKKGQCAIRDKAGNITKSIDCCNLENGTRSTKEIRATSGHSSELDSKRALTGNSQVVGIGSGRSGDGVGTRAGLETNFGDRAFVNASGSGVDFDKSSIFSPWQAQCVYLVDAVKKALKNLPENEAEYYKNKVLTPSASSFKGGDGAVIVTW